MDNKEIHYKRLQQALSQEKLVILQYSCTTLANTNPQVTSVICIDYFLDLEAQFKADDTNFKQSLIEYLKKHKNYFFLLANNNIHYSISAMDLGFKKNETDQFEVNSIDLDDALEYYAENNKVQYFGSYKEKSESLDKRYYLMLLNKLQTSSDWIWGGFEKDIKQYPLLIKSSRAKAKAMVCIIDKFKKNTLKVSYNKGVYIKSKQIFGIQNRIKLYLQITGVIPFLVNVISVFKKIAGIAF